MDTDTVNRISGIDYLLWLAADDLRLATELPSEDTSLRLFRMRCAMTHLREASDYGHDERGE
jgi:hypothetical protein